MFQEPSLAEVQQALRVLSSGDLEICLVLMTGACRSGAPQCSGSPEMGDLRGQMPLTDTGRARAGLPPSPPTARRRQPSAVS